MPFTLHRRLTGGGALLKKRSHVRDRLNAGFKLDADFAGPVKFVIDESTEGRRMPTLFTTPAFVTKRAFYEALLAGGVDNIDPYAVEIVDRATSQRFDDEYLFLNVVGRAECADLAASEYGEMGPDLRMINRLVLDGSKMPDTHIFRLADDITKIVVSDHLKDHLSAAAYEDVHFEPVLVK
ncbi:MAG: hypothetical protein M3303_16140 [Gemmatimonadota bacterium]|nr:hypothetical protein [Gemmatimonadota bacterium]